MREWLNDGDFYRLLPSDLSTHIVEVSKWTNNRGGNTKAGLSVVSNNADKLWLLSMSEVYGDIAGLYGEVYNAEGHQYKFYVDQGVSFVAHTFCAKRRDGVDSWWWLRSPVASSSSCFHVINSIGYWYEGNADKPRGVSPGFCF